MKIIVFGVMGVYSPITMNAAAPGGGAPAAD